MTDCITERVGALEVDLQAIDLRLTTAEETLAGIVNVPEIDDATPSLTKVYSSQKVVDLLAGKAPVSLVDDVASLTALKAPLASPAFTGTPTAPTAAQGTFTTQLATTAFAMLASEAALGLALQQVNGIQGVYPNGAATNVPRGLTQASVGAITPGSGGTNGTFALTWSGGNFTINPTGTFTVAGGAVTAVTITGPGLYLGSSPTVPTPGFAASTGLTGQAVALTAQFLVAAGQGYWVQSSDGLTLTRYNNVAGVATLDAAVGSIPTAAYFGSNVTITAANVETMREGAATMVTLDHTSTDVDLWSSLRAGETIQLFAQDGSNTRIHICWENGATGLLSAGKLTEFELHTGIFWNRSNTALATTTGAKVQAWVVRPTATPSDVHGAAISVNLVKPIGEWALPDNQTDLRDNVKFLNLNIDVQDGDVCAYRIIGAGIRYGANSGGGTEYDNSRSALFSVADLTLDGAFASTRSSTVNAGTSGRRFFHRTKVVKNNAFLPGRGPNQALRLNRTGRTPVGVTRNADNPFHGKRVAVFGSSISTYTGGGTGALKGHIPMLMEMLQCDPRFYAQGGSYGLWPPTGATPGGTYLAYSGMTAAEELARFGTAISSYENRWINDGPFDAVLIHDLMNDTNVPSVFTLGTQGSTDPATVWGNLTRQIDYALAQNPVCMIFLQAPAHVWETYGGSGTPTEQTNRMQYVQTLKDIVAYYRGQVALINYAEFGGISAKAVAAGKGLIDSIHPAETNGPKPRMAMIGYRTMLEFARYFDDQGGY